jgi:hypothetical protein
VVVVVRGKPMVDRWMQILVFFTLSVCPQEPQPIYFLFFYFFLGVAIGAWVTGQD